MNKSNKKKKITLARFFVRSLAISASTLALLDLLKGELQSGGVLAIGWLAIVVAEKRIFNSLPQNENKKNQNE